MNKIRLNEMNEVVDECIAEVKLDLSWESHTSSELEKLMDKLGNEIKEKLKDILL